MFTANMTIFRPVLQGARFLCKLSGGIVQIVGD